MPEWLIERGIGETRSALVADGEIIEARIELEGVARAGSMLDARLISRGANGRNAVARASDGSDYLLPRGAGPVSEGADLRIEVTRSAIPGSEPWKRPLGRIAREGASEPPVPAGRSLTFPGAKDELAAAGWEDLLDEARSGIVRFPGGELTISPTRAMTLIDVDGSIDPHELALAGAAAAARAIRRLDIGGSIGIDLPTVASKDVRIAAAAAVDASLPQPFERTAVNGFGFVQIVRPRRRPSIAELSNDRAAFEARALLRRVVFDRPGAKTLVAHPAVEAVLRERARWLDVLSRQLGGPIGLRADPALTISGAYAEDA